jgi:hypothetical protein
MNADSGAVLPKGFWRRPLWGVASMLRRCCIDVSQKAFVKGVLADAVFQDCRSSDAERIFPAH